jgi:TatD DNase family protein
LLAEIRSMGEGRPAIVIHSFSGPVDYADAMLALGAILSFSGLVFRRGEEASAEVAERAPLERVLVETDSPFLAPPGAPRSRNEPEWVRITADWLAERQGLTDDAGRDRLGDALVDTYDRTFRRDR